MRKSKKTLCVILALLLALGALASCAQKKETKSQSSSKQSSASKKEKPETSGTKAEEYLKTMTTEEKISQMIMPSFRYDSNGEALTQITDDVSAALEKHGFSGVILFETNTSENESAARLVDSMQKSNAKVKGRPQLLISTDQEGGLVNRLGEGTVTSGNMALGAIDDLSVTEETAGIIAGELKALGINADFAPDVDVNSNPSNPVIGVRSFSDDPETVARHGAAFVKSLNGKGIVSTLKHFPGHGDTATDSHTGLPCIDKSLDELRSNELIPFKACIDAGARIIMTAHIEFPQIEKTTYKSKLTGEEIHLPATLSKTIITDILRGELGYSGVITTDALEMDAIARHFDRYDAAKLAIEAGADILLMPVNPTTKEGFEDMDNYISTLAQKAENGEISMEKIDAAVLRILTLKENNGLFEPYDVSDIESRAQSAVNSVGTKENHDKEWEISKKAITLVKNENSALPLKNENEKTVVLVPYDSEVLSMTYARKKLARDGKLPEGTEIEVYSYSGQSLEEVLPKVEDADNIVFVSEIYGSDELRGEIPAMGDSLADYVREKGGRFILMSVGLPYDAARYREADAIVLAYLGVSMSEDPNGKTVGIKKYGANMPAALYVMFSEEDSPAAKLPVDIPDTDESFGFTDDILYSKGFALSY